MKPTFGPCSVLRVQSKEKTSILLIVDRCPLIYLKPNGQQIVFSHKNLKVSIYCQFRDFKYYEVWNDLKHLFSMRKYWFYGLTLKEE